MIPSIIINIKLCNACVLLCDIPGENKCLINVKLLGDV